MLTRDNTNRWLINTLIFIRPVVLIYLGYISTNIGTHGFIPAELIPNSFIAGAMVLYLVNVITDYLRKLDDQSTIKIALADSKTEELAQEIDG